MLANLFRPWILARLTASMTAALLVLLGVWTAARVLSHFSIARTSEGQLALERRAELVSSLVEVALGTTVLGLCLAMVGADRMTASIRGAMCAWGVLDASPWGFRSLFASIGAALGCALWIAVHRLDLRLRAPTLTRAKFAALFVVAPLVLADGALAVQHALSLDLRVVATCCSTGLDATVRDAGTAVHRAQPIAAALFALAAAVAVGLGALNVRRARAGLATALGVASAAAAVASVPAVIGWVAPHAFESPAHLCPFCLLHGDVLGLGWPLFASLFGGTALGLSAGLVGRLERASGEPETARAMAARLGGAASLAWGLALALAAAPVVRWMVLSGGASLFGDA